MVLGLSTSLQYDSPQEWAKKHKEIGAGAVVFPLNCHAPEAEIDAFAKAAHEEGLIIAEVGVWKNTLAADPKERQEAIQYAIGQLKMADRIGARCCVNIIGTSYGPRWDGAYAGNFSKEAWEDAILMIRQIIDAVNPVNTKYTIETMPWMYPTGPDEYLQMIKEVDRPGFGVHMDFVNMVNCPSRYFFPEAFMEECFDKLKGKIVSCHMKNVRLLQEYTFQLRECGCEEGTLPLEKYAQLATKECADMPMIIEHLNSDEEYLKSMLYMQKRLGLAGE